MKFRNTLLVIFSTLLICLLFVKAGSTPLTYDEAYSFLYFVTEGDFFSVALANNHPLNTFLMWALSQLGESEIILRMPNIFSGIVFIIFACFLALKTEIKIFAFCLLTLCPYLFEFFTLGRGYGISATLTFCAFVLHFFGHSVPKPSLSISILLICSAFSYYPMIIVCGLFGCCLLYKFWRGAERRLALTCFSLLFLGSLFPLWAMREVSLKGKPLHGSTHSDIFEIFGQFLGVRDTFDPNVGIYGTIACLILFTPFPLLKQLSRVTREMSAISLSSLFLFLSIAYFSERPLPTGRLLVPFLPPLLVASVLCWNDLIAKIPEKISPLVAFIFSLFLISNFLRTLKISDTFDWSVNRVEPSEARKFQIRDDRCYYDAADNPAVHYYRRQAKLSNAAYCDEPTGKPIN